MHPNTIDQGQIHHSSKQYNTDHISRAIQHEIDRTTLNSFEFYVSLGGNVFIYPACSTGQKNDVGEPSNGHIKYYLGFRRRFQTPVYVKLDRNGQFRICYLTEWKHVSQLLTIMVSQSLPEDRTNPADKHMQWLQQWRWWKAIGKAFRFLDLPSEVREIIYSFALVTMAQPYPYSKHRRIRNHQAQVLACGNPNINLLLTGKQIYMEGSHVMFRESVFFIEHRQILRKLHYSNPRIGIAHLHLALHHSEYLRLFGAVPEDDSHNSSPKDGSSRNGKAACAFRYFKLIELIIEILPAQRVIAWGVREYICLKCFIDQILEAAFRWVKGHPVKVVGWLKTTQKESFEARCGIAHTEYMKWCDSKPLGYDEGLLSEWDEYVGEEDGGVRLDGNENLRAETGTPDKEIFLECLYHPKCEDESWSPKY